MIKLFKIMGKNKKRRSDVVYSTNSEFKYQSDNEQSIETLPANEQKLYVSHDRKQRKGKTVTLVEGFVGLNEDLNDLCKFIKTKCGVGGTAKEGSILIQGELRDKVISLLEGSGYRTVRKGG